MVNSCLIFLILCILIFNFTIYFDQTHGQTQLKERYLNKGTDHPQVADTNLKVEEVADGLRVPTTMAFLGPDDFLILEKDTGTVMRVNGGIVSDLPLLDVDVANSIERGMCGIAVSKNGLDTIVYLYYTEIDGNDGSDRTGKAPIGNRLYKYELVDNKLVNPVLLLDLPADPGPRHNGGAIQIGPDNNIYVTIGDLNNKNTTMKVQNIKTGADPDGRAGILRVTQDGKAVGNGILGPGDPLNKYYAYGLRNSFGIDFDPARGYLWDTENGPDYADEINLVEPGFNSGWKVLQGIWKPFAPPEGDYIAGAKLLKPDNYLANFGGKGHYRSPEFIWKNPVGPSAIKFLSSDKLGKIYENDMFVGCVNLGVIFHFDLSEDRTKLKLAGVLEDKIADNEDELEDVIFARGFGSITDIDVGPDGYMYVLSSYMDNAAIFRIVPINN